MKPAQLLLAYMRLVERERELRDEIERVESLLASDPSVAHAEQALADARAEREAIQLRLRESDRDREDHRTRLRSREKELMSGRIRSPSELIQMNEEVQHMRARFAEEEDRAVGLQGGGVIAELLVQGDNGCVPAVVLPRLAQRALQANLFRDEEIVHE